MPSLLRRVAGGAQRFLRPETIELDGSVIPAGHLRFGGANFASDVEFLRSGEREAKRLVDGFGLTRESSVLEIGFGTGRLPIGILRTVGDIARYRGVDVSATAVAWCKRNIERAHPTFQFQHIDVRNDRYNPGGRDDADFRLPFENESADIIYLYSVFSHLLQADVEKYLREFHRLLSSNGKVFLTAFIEEDVEPVSENPAGYRQPEWKGALHCVRYDKKFFESLLDAHGLAMTGFDYATETDGQSGVVLTRA